MVALNTDHFAANTYIFPDPLPPTAQRPVRTFLDLDHKAQATYYFQPESQYYDLFKEAIETGERDSVYQLRRSYVRENKSDTCFTLMANMGEGGHNQPVVRDRWGIRKMTPRECARLQGYSDDWFKIPTTLSNTQVYKQIGNSVTVPLVARLARNVLECLATITRQTETKAVKS
jgi:DNA (cytosine-5)-methyltransferase 1